MKKILIFIFLFISLLSQSQTYIKGNAITALILIPNFGVETSIGRKFTFQADIMSSFWKSFNGNHPMEFYSLIAEVRYHFQEKYNGFYSLICCLADSSHKVENPRNPSKFSDSVTFDIETLGFGLLSYYLRTHFVTFYVIPNKILPQIPLELQERTWRAFAICFSFGNPLFL
jgi:hypothetical protein